MARFGLGGLCLLALLAAWPLQAGPLIQTWTTASGARVMFYPAPELPMLDIRATFAAGSVRDGTHAGVASMTNGLLAEGAAGLDAQEIAERFERAGARFANGAQREMAWVALRTLTDPTNLEPALDTFVHVLSRPDFKRDDVERLRLQMLSALNELEQSASSVAERAFYRALYADHPYANPPQGERTSIAALDSGAVRAFYERYYVARNLTLALVGDIDRQTAGRIAQEITAGLPAGEKAGGLPPAPAPQAGKTVRVPFPSRQSHILIGTIGMRRGERDYFDLYVANHVFGGSGFASRLLSTIRERHGLAYSAYSYFLPMAERGPFVLGMQTRNTQTDKAIDLALRELEAYLADGASAGELEASQRNITGGFALRIDSNRKLLQQLTTIGFYDLPLDYLDLFTDRINAVSTRSLHQALRARIDPQNMVTVIVGGDAG